MTENAQRSLDRIVVAFGLCLILGPLLTWGTALSNAQDHTKGGSSFYVQYHSDEPIFLGLMAAFALATTLVIRRTRADDGSDGTPALSLGVWNAARLAGVALLVFALAVLGTSAVMHRFPFAMDEFVAEFQAWIFASGRVTVAVPQEWQPFVPALRPVYVGIDEAGRYWTSSYWPVYSAIRALFLMAGADSLVNPLFAALSVILAYACARRIWPNDERSAWLAAVFLASSSQLLFMSMTAYAMPAHLCFNLLWLYAYVRGDRAGWIATPLIGVAALGLHNPFPHALFAAPFLLQLATRKRWRWTAYFAAVYGVGIIGWLAWMVKFQSPLTGPIPIRQLFELPGLPMVFTQALSVSIFLTWQTPLLAVLVVWTTLAWRSLSGTERCLLAGIVLSFAFHTFLYTSQGHGWGYRYAYATIGSMALLGAAGASRASKIVGWVPVRQLVIGSVILTIVLQWPVRAWQIERRIRPVARLHDYIAHIDADVVIIDPTSSWYGIDLIRNDAFLTNRPKVLSSYYLGPQEKYTLAERFGGRVHLLEAREIAQFGIPTFPSKYRRPVWPPSYPHDLASVPRLTGSFSPAVGSSGRAISRARPSSDRNDGTTTAEYAGGAARRR